MVSENEEFTREVLMDNCPVGLLGPISGCWIETPAQRNGLHEPSYGGQPVGEVLHLMPGQVRHNFQTTPGFGTM